MKTTSRSLPVCFVFIALIIAAAATSISRAESNTVPAKVGSIEAPRLNLNGGGTYYYEVDFAGGPTTDFFKFWRTNGFDGDSVLSAGNVDDVYIPAFKLKDARLSEIAKSIEFVSEGRLSVEVIERTAPARGNIWRVKLADIQKTFVLKTKACAVPHLLVGTKGGDRVNQISEYVQRALLQGAENLYRDSSVRPRGDVTILESEKIVVIVGTEAYVEAVASALEAAESVEAQDAIFREVKPTK